MANIVPFTAQVPAHLAALNTPSSEFLGGIKDFMSVPKLGANKGTFYIKADGATTPITGKFQGPEGIVELPLKEVKVVILGAKPTLDRAYYAEAYDPKAEAKEPDCFSRDGVKPDPSCAMKQCATCAGCPMNEFGSAQQGNGKACREHQKIAVATNTGVYEFSLPATSWKNYRAYVKEAARHQINNLALVSTVLGFDSNFDYTVFSFGFGGYLDENQARKIAEMKNGEVYEAIIGSAPKEVIPALPEAPAAPVLKVVKPVEEAVYAPVEETVYAPVEEEPVKAKSGRAGKVKEVEPVKASDLSSLAASLGLEL